MPEAKLRTLFGRCNPVRAIQVFGGEERVRDGNYASQIWK